MLKLDVRPGESIAVGDVAVITLEKKSGKAARLSVRANKSVKIERIKRPGLAQYVAKNGLAKKPLALSDNPISIDGN
ncbi:carbon storage regulator [Zhongshania sp.]|uniref:carbon storage regulator n=1 Tax=Zhongshania sp. TaxID=1971902 RepID=UPI003567B725